MPLYDYRCPEGTTFEVFFTMQDKPDTTPCPHCGAAAPSVLPAIGLSQNNSANMRILDATKSTADTPQVVSSISGVQTGAHRPTAVTRNPLHQKLPRP